jgi:hypothetical protein
VIDAGRLKERTSRMLEYVESWRRTDIHWRRSRCSCTMLAIRMRARGFGGLS